MRELHTCTCHLRTEYLYVPSKVRQKGTYEDTQSLIRSKAHFPPNQSSYSPGNCSRSRNHADRTGRGLRLERVPHSAHEGVWMNDFAGDLHLHDRYSDARFRGICRWSVDAKIGTTHCGNCGGHLLWAGRFPCEFFGRAPLLAVLLLRVPRRNWLGLGLHRARRHTGEMVP